MCWLRCNKYTVVNELYKGKSLLFLGYPLAFAIKEASLLRIQHRKDFFFIPFINTITICGLFKRNLAPVTLCQRKKKKAKKTFIILLLTFSLILTLTRLQPRGCELQSAKMTDGHFLPSLLSRFTNYLAI